MFLAIIDTAAFATAAATCSAPAGPPPTYAPPSAAGALCHSRRPHAHAVAVSLRLRRPRARACHGPALSAARGSARFPATCVPSALLRRPLAAPATVSHAASSGPSRRSLRRADALFRLGAPAASTAPPLVCKIFPVFLQKQTLYHLYHYKFQHHPSYKYFVNLYLLNISSYIHERNL